MSKRTIAVAVAVAATLTALGAGAAQAAFPGPNGRIAFAAEATDANGNVTAATIEAVNADGSARSVLVACRPPLRACLDRSPSFSPGGRLVALERDGQLAIASVADGSILERLGPFTPRDSEPVFSADGQRLAFSGQRGSGPLTDVWTVGCEACGPRQVTRKTGAGAVWSSTDRIAFARSGNVYLMSPTGRSLKRLTFKGGASPAWSPHATKVVFVRAGNLYLVGANGSGLDKLTGRGGAEPAWSPDGRQIAFVRGGEIYVVGSDGSGLRKVAARAAGATGQRLAAPDWQPAR